MTTRKLPRLSLRGSVLGMASLAVVICAVSLFALARIISTTESWRIERGRSAVVSELERMRAQAKAGDGPTLSVVGLRGGYLKPGVDVADVEAAFDDSWHEPWGLAQRDAVPGGPPSVVERKSESGMLLIGAARSKDGGLAWAGYTVSPHPNLEMWRRIVVVLAIGALLLVGTGLFTVMSLRRDAATLTGALAALSRDLRAPVPHPGIRELATVAEGIGTLVRELDAAQRERARLATELAEQGRLATLGRVTAGVAHEVRNPLASMKLRIDLSLGRADVPADLAAELGEVSSEITRLDRLVADLLVVAGRRAGPRSREALGTLARRRVDLLSPWAAERRVRIAETGDADAVVEPEAVARAIDNLVKNAVEASHPGGLVEVEVRGGERTVVSVLDEGTGVPTDREGELFEPFFTTKPDGTGLGLALSRAIAASHGGTLCYRRDGARTRFELSFPRPEAS
jgi:signal transduction histidine kinase